jgi:hypothetical protein
MDLTDTLTGRRHSVSNVAFRARRIRELQGRAALVRAVLARVAYGSSTHIWFAAPARDLAASPWGRIEVVEVVGPPSLAVAASVWPLTEAEAEERLNAGDRLWVAADTDGIVFSVWTCTNRARLGLSKVRTIALPEDTIVLENLCTAASARGRSIAARGIAGVCRAAAEVQDVVAAVTVQNCASQRAIAKAGLVEIARTSTRRIGPRRRTSVVGASAFADRLRAGVAAR